MQRKKNEGIVAIIPARGGSKRVPHKNIKLLNGKPLIYYTIIASLKSKMINKTIVSTDSIKICEVADKYGTLVKLRDKKLAQDNTPTEDVMLDVAKEVPADYYVLLQPTSPLRDEKIIDEAIKDMLKNNYDSYLSVTEVPHYYLMGGFGGNGDYKPHYDKRPRSQDMPKMYRENGALFITKRDILLKTKNRLGGKIGAIVMNELQSVDIDEEKDFKIVEELMRNDILF